MARRKAGGRKSLCTPALTKRFVSAIEGGDTLRGAADACGISETTVHRWLSAGEREDADKRYREFRQAVLNARATAKQTAISKVLASDDWRAHAWWLERRHPKDFGKRVLSEVQVQTKVEELLGELKTQMPPEAFKELVHAVARLQGLDVEPAGGDAGSAPSPGAVH